MVRLKVLAVEDVVEPGANNVFLRGDDTTCLTQGFSKSGEYCSFVDAIPAPDPARQDWFEWIVVDCFVDVVESGPVRSSRMWRLIIVTIAIIQMIIIITIIIIIIIITIIVILIILIRLHILILIILLLLLLIIIIIIISLLLITILIILIIMLYATFS